MKVVSVVGARPQFIKASVLSRVLRKEHKEVLVHTGQHYDSNMSDVFFQELGIPTPEYNLGVGSGSHGAQTGAMLKLIEEILLIEQPDWVLVYGDTNSTLAGALAASKLHIKVAHVEAGLRSFNRVMPEEINRVVTDHVSDVLFCPTQTAFDNLSAEGIHSGVYLVGDVMYDALMWALEQNKNRTAILEKFGVREKKYLLATIHRAENTDNPTRLKGILDALNYLDEKIIFPVHPRTQQRIDGINWQPAPHVQMIKPVGYLDMIRLEQEARVIFTDSGGVQKEAYWLCVPCITFREETEWVETIETGANRLVGIDPDLIVKCANTGIPYGLGKVSLGSELGAARCISILASHNGNE